jgi:hypothetical protein
MKHSFFKSVAAWGGLRKHTLDKERLHSILRVINLAPETMKMISFHYTFPNILSYLIFLIKVQNLDRRLELSAIRSHSKSDSKRKVMGIFTVKISRQYYLDRNSSLHASEEKPLRYPFNVGIQIINSPENVKEK